MEAVGVEWRVRAIRGATTVAENTDEEIREAVMELLDELEVLNQLEPDQIISATFSVTGDLDAIFPAQVARSRPYWDNVPLFDVQQMHVEGSLPRCIRFLIHVNLPTSQGKINHPYLREARRLRPDWSLPQPAASLPPGSKITPYSQLPPALKALLADSRTYGSDSDAEWRVRGIRGATTVSENTAEAIQEAVMELLDELEACNLFKPTQIISATFSVTRDLDAVFPAAMARKRPHWDNVALFDVQQLHVEGSMPRCIRLLLLVNLPASNVKLSHVYLRDAKSLRPNLSWLQPTVLPSPAMVSS